jgi:membrane protein implicated in regulation of membrane protease activity
MRWHWYDTVQLLGSIASITGLSLLAGASTWTPGIVLVLIVVGVFATVIASIIARAQPMTKVGREAMIDTGKSVVRAAKKNAIMFGGDMSWASDYEEAIRYAADRGKTVIVIFPKSTAPKVVQNAALMASAGAKLFSTQSDIREYPG